MKNFFTIIILLLSVSLSAQDDWWQNSQNEEKENSNTDSNEETKETNVFSAFSDIKSQDSLNENNSYREGKVTIKKNSAIDKVIEFKAATIPPYYGPTMDGYRVQLFFDQNKDEVEKKRKEANEFDREIPLYVKYEAPNYFLLLGDYRTKLEAEKIRAKLLSDFPEAIIRSDRIYLPKIKD